MQSLKLKNLSFKSLISDAKHFLIKTKKGKAVIIAFTAYLIIPSTPLWKGIDYSTAFYDKNGQLLRLTTTIDQKFRLRTPIKRVSNEMVNATLLYEDKYFYFHYGINPFAIARSIWNTYIIHSRKMGGSTITMQVARLRYHLDTSTIPGKLKQMVKAIQLERHYTKKEILEAYFTLAPYGKNIEGVGAASLIYFRKNPEELNLKEALALANIPQNPVANSPATGNDGVNHNPSLEKARERLFALYKENYPVTHSSESIIHDPLQIHSRSSLPFEAPHLTDYLLNRNFKGFITTTIDIKFQQMVERKLRLYISARKKHGIYNGAVAVIHYPTMELRAMAGSADYFNNEIFGQVNGTDSQRSPGSTLKPFVYALAIDQGIIHPGTILKDSPVGFGTYSPENNDGDFKGPVTAQDALNNSRNIPATILASKIQNPDLYQILRMAGVEKLHPRSHYGLAIVLGSVEVTMLNLVELYASLGNLGKFSHLNMVKTDSPEAGQSFQLFSPEAAFITREMMTHNPRPGSWILSRYAATSPSIAWKTGTSYGYKDGWSVAVAGEYVLAVWMGNFDGTGSPSFTGAGSAAPLLFQLIDVININEAIRFPKPEEKLNITETEVCTASGGLPGPYCPARNKILYIPGVSPIEPDTVYRKVTIYKESGLQACSNREGPDVYQEIYEFWPSDILSIFERYGVPRKTPPPLSPECRSFSKRRPPEITSPRKGVTYSVSHSQNSHHIPFTAVTDADVRTIFWFVNTEYAGSSQAGDIFTWIAHAGHHTVTAVDDRGKNDSVEIDVTVRN